MRSFLKLVGANILATILVFSFLIFGGFGLMLALSFSVEQSKVAVKDKSVLVIDLSMNIPDAPPQKSIAELVGEAIENRKDAQVYLLEVIDAIDQATHDSRISAIFLEGSLNSRNYGSGYAALRELRQALEEFKASGKPIYAYAVSPSLKDYYLMSAADHLTLNPFGLLSFNGMASETLYLAKAFEKYGVGLQTTRVGKYKSAVEMFTREDMSEANRYQIEELISGIWEEIVSDVAFSRKIEYNDLLALANDEGFFEADQALEKRLIDKVAYWDEIITELSETFAKTKSGNTFQQISLAKYIMDTGSYSNKLKVFESENQVAVIYAQGDIVDGEGNLDQIGGDRIARSLRKVRNDEKVKAVVLRVNSPGGSAVASEIIQREMRELKKVKPVIVSMGSLAASGGYWISAYSDKIYAEPYTITGSIGVWGMLFNFEDMAKNVGITFDGVKTSPFSDIYTVTRPKTDEELALIQKFTDMIYDEFIRKVSEGRSMEPAEVINVAEGRVWTGLDALEVGLVDELGGLQDAIAFAVKSANLGSDWSLVQIPEKEDLTTTLEKLIEEAEKGTPMAKVANKGALGRIVDLVQREFQVLESFNDPKGVYARLPFEVILK